MYFHYFIHAAYLIIFLYISKSTVLNTIFNEMSFIQCWHQRKQVGGAISCSHFLLSSWGFKTQWSVFWVGYLALNWSSFSFYSLLYSTPTHTFTVSHKHTTHLCHLSGNSLASYSSSLTSPSVTLSTSHRHNQTRCRFAAPQNSDGFMNLPIWPGHSGTRCTFNFLPRRVTQAKVTSFKTSTES